MSDRSILARAPVGAVPSVGFMTYRRPPTPEETYPRRVRGPVPVRRSVGARRTARVGVLPRFPPERFAPLHDVARALAAHLVETYEVEVRDDDDRLDRLTHRPTGETVEVVALEPAGRTAAPLTFWLTSYPGVVVLAGVLDVAVLPYCGCDACDEPVPEIAADLERLVDAVVEGRFEERVRPRRHWVQIRRWYPDGEETSTERRTDFPRDQFDAAAARLAEVGGRWRPWPRRVAAPG